ncbi:MAG: FAD:protein FMN transferase [Fibrobacterota bacterium]
MITVHSATPAFRALVGALMFLLPGCTGDSPEHVKRTFFRLDTAVEVTLVRHGHTDSELKSAFAAIDSLLKDWEERFSQTHPRSEVLALNQRTGPAVPVSPELARILFDARRYYDTLQGTLDVTVLPIKELWGFGEKESVPHLPSVDSIALALKRVDGRKITVDTLGNIVHFAAPEIRVDVGGVAKGIIFKKIRTLLGPRGFPDYLFVEGGDISMGGRRGDRTPWRLGVQHPRASDRLLATLALDSGALVTSGDYERFFVKDGKRYCHIFDPRTGYSVAHNQSVTLWAMDPVELDMLSTGLFCWMPDAILAFVESRPRLQCIVVDSAGGIRVSHGWKSRVRFK